MNDACDTRDQRGRRRRADSPSAHHSIGSEESSVAAAMVGPSPVVQQRACAGALILALEVVELEHVDFVPSIRGERGLWTRADSTPASEASTYWKTFVPSGSKTFLRRLECTPKSIGLI
jgi:hypothetical protein